MRPWHSEGDAHAADRRAALVHIRINGDVFVPVQSHASEASDLGWGWSSKRCRWRRGVWTESETRTLAANAGRMVSWRTESVLAMVTPS